MERVDIVPATAELLQKFYGRPPLVAVKALVAVYEGEPICVGGYLQTGFVAIPFTDVRPVMRERFVLTGVKMAKRVMAMVRASGLTMVARPDLAIEPSVRFLEYLGFERQDNGSYLCRAG